MKNQFVLDFNEELIWDNFAGGGGASLGIYMGLGRHVDHAVNHAEDALGMHRINHPQTVHHHEDVFSVNVENVCRGRKIGLGWFSPDCKHFSKAKGGKPVNKKIRGLAYVILRYAKAGARVMYGENVEEIETWGPLLRNGKPDPKHRGRTWKSLQLALGPGLPLDNPDLDEMLDVLEGVVSREELIRGFGYQFESRKIRACNLGVRTIRNRLYFILRNDGKPIVWPTQTHFDPKLAKLGQKRWNPVSDCLDFRIPTPSIFLGKKAARIFRCKRPLAKSTYRRIAIGTDRHILKAKKPFIISLTHQGGDRVESIDDPAKTITGAHRGERAFVDAQIAPFITEHANASAQRNISVDRPLPTQCAEVKGGHFALCAAHLTKFNTGAIGSALTDPIGTITAGSHSENTHGGAATPHGLATANLIKLRGTNIGDSTDAPLHTVSAGGTHHAISVAALIKYYGTDQDPRMDEPCHTVTTKPRFGLTETHAVQLPLTSDQILGAKRVAKFLRSHGIKFEGEFATVKVGADTYVIVDIGMRMLTPRELFRAQGFPDDYIIDRAWLVDKKTGVITEVRLTKEQQIRMCGNSVCPPVAAALVRLNSPELAIWSKQEVAA